MDGIQQYYWQDKDKEQSLRIVTNPQDAVIGFNVLGIRLHQQVCEDWINQGLNINEVIARLDELDFSPEFSGRLAKTVKPELVQ